MDWAGFWFVLSVVGFLGWMQSRDNRKSEAYRADSLKFDVDDARATINELETERDILRASVELERTRADANYEAGKILQKDLNDAQRMIRFAQRALRGEDMTPTVKPPGNEGELYPELPYPPLTHKVHGHA